MSYKPYDYQGFVGDFKELLIQFIQMKRSLGYAYRMEANVLKRFSRFTLDYSIKEHSLAKELATAWTGRRPNEKDVTREKRIYVLRQFAIYLNNLGYQSYIPSCKARINRLYVPHIFTHEELRLFFAECNNIQIHPLSNKHLTFPVIYRLLYACGLRISEALALKLKDVDLKDGIIAVHGSKFSKDRLIPMSSSLTTYLQAYCLKIHTLSTSEDYFFMKRDNTPISSETVYKTFRKILWKCGISHGGKGRGPRLHDFRHTFAVYSLNQMVRQGIDLYCALPILSAYLGHASVGATEKYVRLTREAYPEILSAMSQSYYDILPEVNAI